MNFDQHRALCRCALLLFYSLLSFPQAYSQWQAQDSQTIADLQSASFPDTLHGWAVGNGGVIIRTRDAGLSWTPQQSFVSTPLLSVSFCDTVHGWAVGSYGVILKSTDGGEHWQRISHDTSEFVENLKVQCISPSDVAILRDSFEFDFYTNYRIWVSADSGKAWSSTLISQMPITDFSFLSKNLGWASGISDIPLRNVVYRKGSSGWSSSTFDRTTQRSPQKLHFDAALTGWLSDGDTLFQTTDGGSSWSILSIPHFGRLSSLMKEGNDGYVSTTSGKVGRTTDGGSTWIMTLVSGGLPISSLAFPTLEIGWAVGGGGLIFHTINGGTTSVNGWDAPQLTASPILIQNYPNPFNPSTVISFGIPQTATVTLRVFNTFGQEVANLLDEVQSAGYHEVVFDGSGLASGLYFYRLQAGTYTDTKKLMLLK